MSTPARGRQLPAAALAAIALLLLLRLALLDHVVLLPQEAYYWMYAKHLAWGYLDHPPMVGWLIAAGTWMFGDTEFGVRIIAWLLGATTTYLCYRLAADWCGRRAGVAAAVVYCLTPLLGGTGFFITPDAPLLFFWLATLVAVTRAARTGRMRWWLLAGLTTGAAFLSKYPAIFLVVSTALYLLSARVLHRHLRTPGPWLALLLAGLVASPVIAWNVTHDWASFQFQFARRLGEHTGLQPTKTLASLGLQFLLLTPHIFALLVFTLWIVVRRFRRDRTGRWRLAVCFSLPWLAVCGWHGLFATVKLNWPLPAYLSLLPAAAALLRSRGLPLLRRHSWARRRVLLRRYVVALALVNVVVLAFFAVGTMAGPRDGLTQRLQMVRAEFAEATGSAPFLLAEDTYHLLSQLAFYAKEPDRVLSGQVSYRYWRQPADFVGQDALAVLREVTPEKLALLKASFAQVDEPEELYTFDPGFGRPDTTWVIRCYEFRGTADVLRL